MSQPSLLLLVILPASIYIYSDLWIIRRFVYSGILVLTLQLLSHPRHFMSNANDASSENKNDFILILIFHKGLNRVICLL